MCRGDCLPQQHLLAACGVAVKVCFSLGGGAAATQQQLTCNRHVCKGLAVQSIVLASLDPVPGAQLQMHKLQNERLQFLRCGCIGG